MTVIAIDFGTSNTAIAMLDGDGLPQTVALPEISQDFAGRQQGGDRVWLVPSLVYIAGIGDRRFGEQAKAQALSKRLFQGFKRDLVANFRSPARELDGEYYDAEAIAAIFLAEIWRHLMAIATLQPIAHLIFTVPVGAFEAYLTWLRDLGAELQLPQFQVIDESTAAALGYGITRPNALVLVIDFGGGTLDLSLVRTAPIASASLAYQAEVIAKADAYIGGIDVDRWIAEYFLRQIDDQGRSPSASTWLHLLKIAEEIKIDLSINQEANAVWLDDWDRSHKLQLSQMELAEILEQQQFLEQVREAIDEVLSMGLNRGVSKAAIEQILLVGGSCQLVAVQQLISSYFGKAKVRMNKPFEAVAHGALVLNQAIAIADHLRHSYAIRLWEPYLQQYGFYPIFAKGTQYPCQSQEPLILQAAIAGQAEIWLDIGEVADIAQSEVRYDRQGRMISSQLVKKSDFRSLAPTNRSDQGKYQEKPQDKHQEKDQVCIAKLEPLGQLGSDRISINFAIDERRILIATVSDLLTKKVLINQQAIAKLE